MRRTASRRKQHANKHSTVVSFRLHSTSSTCWCCRSTIDHITNVPVFRNRMDINTHTIGTGGKTDVSDGVGVSLNKVQSIYVDDRCWYAMHRKFHCRITITKRAQFNVASPLPFTEIDDCSAAHIPLPEMIIVSRTCQTYRRKTTLIQSFFCWCCKIHKHVFCGFVGVGDLVLRNVRKCRVETV